MKRIITITTDFGLADHYVGAMKGVVLDISPDSIIVDISHEIPKYDITKASFMVQNFHKYFPKDSIHVVVVDPGVGSERKPVAVQTEQGIFVGPDNGVFSFVLDDSAEVFEITNKDFMLHDISSTFHGRDIFAPTAAHLSRGLDIKEVGPDLSSPKLLNFNQPDVTDNKVIGEIIYQDSFGNLITNIPAKLVNGASQVVIGKHIIDTVANSYAEVCKGELLAIIGSSGYLEISVSQGSASNLMKDKIVTVIK